MKKGDSKLLRAVVSLALVLLTGGFLWVGVPALAAGNLTSGVRQNVNPIAENLELSTFKNIPIHGQFTATDPDGDDVIFEVADGPKKGSVQAEKNGRFVYTPGDNKKGRDSFTYIAIDESGNISNKATVTVTIDKQSTKITYADMADHHAHYAALALAENGVLIGEKLGNEYFFRPDSVMTRGEFLSLCLNLSDTEMLKGIIRTGFSDDSSIPAWAKPYVSTALMSGIITGFKDDEGRLVFAAQEPVTFCEAAVVLDNLLKIPDVAAVSAMAQDTCPAWSYQAETNLTACDIMPVMGTACGENVTRADAAEMLVAALDIIKDRDGGSLLLKWAK